MKNSKFMKVIIALCLALAMCGSAFCFTGCTHSDSKKDPRTHRSSDKDDDEDEDEDDEEDDDEDEDEDAEDDKDDKKSKSGKDAKDKDDKDDEDEDDKEDASAVKEVEETEAETEPSVEETEEADDTDSNSQKISIGDDDIGGDDIGDDVEVDLNSILGELDPSVFESKTIQDLAKDYLDKGYFLYEIEKDFVTDTQGDDGEDITKDFTEGFMGMSGDFTSSTASAEDYSMVMVMGFDSYESAEKFFNSMENLEEPKETAEGKTVTVMDGSSKATLTLTNDGIIILEGSMI